MMQRFTEFWEQLIEVNWVDWITQMPWWGWVAFGVFLAIGVVILAGKDAARGCGTIVFLLALAVIGGGVTILTLFTGQNVTLVITIFFPPMAGLLIGGGIGLVFAEKGKAERCPDCGGRIVQEKYIHPKSKRTGERTVCKSCGKTWLDSLD
jgi:predicted RNA-binding Zn-ribbon protein involved in translation (DUF1610 family)